MTGMGDYQAVSCILTEFGDESLLGKSYAHSL